MRGILVFLLLGLLAAGGAQAQPSEYQLKAVFLLNFARYIEWPASRLAAQQPIELCLLGRDPFGQALEGVNGKQAQGHELRVRSVISPEEGADCHVLFVSGSEEGRIGAVLRTLAGQPVLTVSDIEGFAQAGGSIGFATIDDRVRFDINAKALQRAGLKASAQLMKIAREVIGLGVAR